MTSSLRRPSTSSAGSTKYAFPLLFISILLIAQFPFGTAAGFRLCGLKLTMTLNAICKNQLCGGGYIMGLNKRKSPDLDASTDLESDADVGPQLFPDLAMSPKEQREEGGEVMTMTMPGSRGNRQKRSYYYPYGAFSAVKKSGIATECCSKRCTLSYLKTYCCAAPTTLFQKEEEEENNNE